MDDKKREVIMSMLSPLRSTDRLLMATSAYEKWTQYQNMFHTAEEEYKRNPKLESKLASHVSAMLFEGEVHLNAFFKETLISINALKDTGMLEAALTGAIKRFAKNDDTLEIEEVFKNAEDKIKASNKEVNLDFLTKAKSLCKKHIRTIQSSKGQLHISAILGEEEHLLVVEPTPRPGHLGRIDCEQLFGPTINKTNILVSRPMFVRDSCHNLRFASEGKENASSSVVDLYGSIVAGMTYTKETVYWLARRTNEVGLGAFEGRDPATIGVGLMVAGILCMVVGAAVLITGIALGDQDLIWLGAILFLLGGAMAVGGYILATIYIMPIAPSLIVPLPTLPPPDYEDIDLTDIPNKKPPRRPRPH